MSRARSANSLQIPSFNEERILEAQGYRYIAGIDEVGRGALAGPVLAAAVILPRNMRNPWVKLVRDSKMLTPAKREVLSGHLHRAAVAIGVGAASLEIIDTRGIVRATQLAMKRAVEHLATPPEALLIDYVRLPGVELPQKGVVDGDSLCISIACASIIAKVTRDRLMRKLDRVYPGYGLARHKGYGTEEHLACLCRLGASPVHRRSFRPVRDMIIE
ncbi:MAG: ribonuclease HII [Dehalococcoidales bacterium]|nr:ribonuclease HII [Dehalococcoidales bacterium]